MSASSDAVNSTRTQERRAPRMYLRLDHLFGTPSPHRARPNSGWAPIDHFEFGAGYHIDLHYPHDASDQEKPELHEFELTLMRRCDAYSHLLFAALSSRRAFKQAVIEIVDEEARHVLLRLVLRHVVLSYLSSAHAEDYSDDDSEASEESSSPLEQEPVPVESDDEDHDAGSQSISIGFAEMEYITFAPDREPLAVPEGVDLSQSVTNFMSDTSNHRLWTTPDVVQLILMNLDTVGIHRFGKVCKLFALAASSTALRTIAKHSVKLDVAKGDFVSALREVVNFEGKTRGQMLARGMYYEDEEDDFL